MLALLDVNLELYDWLAAIAGVLLVVAGVLARPDRGAPVGAYTTTIAYLGIALFFFAALLLTP